MKSPPCKNCENRKPGCHGKCEKYAECRADISRAADNKRSQSAADSFQTDNYLKGKYDWIRSHK